MSVNRLVGLAALGLAFALVAAPARADELKRLHAQILRDPTNTELNFRYAELAEQRGEIRKALVAYERVLVNDPNNPEVHARLQRIRRMLQPDVTQFYVQLGAAYESNPERRPNGSDDASLIARFSMRDERGIGNGYRWRTIGQLSGEAYIDNGDLSYGYASFYTGPLVDVTPTIAMHAALGGAAAYFDHKFFYKEATANVTFESFIDGAFHTVRVRGGYRDYESGFSSDDGFYADVTGRFTYANIFGSDVNFTFAPWYRWSDMGGSGFSVLVPNEQVQPGRYHEFGAGIEFNRRLLDWLSFGVGFAASQRKYADGILFDEWGSPVGPVSRRDVLLAPHATMTFHKVFNDLTDLRLHYRFEHNDSTLAHRDYENHIATLLLIARY